MAELRRYGSILGASGIVLGAFGSHGLKEMFEQKPGSQAKWQRAVTYQMMNAAALLAISTQTQSASSKSLISYSLGGRMIALGTTMFSGSIYCFCVDLGPKALLGPATPLGGLIMVGGWIIVGLM